MRQAAEPVGPILNKDRLRFLSRKRGRIVRMRESFVFPASLCLGLVMFSGCGITLAPPGFVRESTHGICRGWFDVNSHRRPSFTLERYERLPPNSARVKLFRHQHGGSVDSPKFLNQTERSSSVLYSEAASASPVPENRPNITLEKSPCVEEFSQEEKVEVPPPAPPSEPAETAAPEETVVPPPVEIPSEKNPVEIIGFSTSEEPSTLPQAAPVKLLPLTQD